MDPEVASFDGLWAGGYYEGDPRDPHARSTYSAIDESHGYLSQPTGLAAQQMGFVSTLYATYLTTIRGRLPDRATVLEIGPGRGAWTKALLGENPDHVYALDALSAEHNGFWEYVGANQSQVTYAQVEDFECSPVPYLSIDFFFSFGVFCHISRRGTEAYFRSIRQRMKPDSYGFCMISDYGQMGRAYGIDIPEPVNEDPEPGRWFHLGKDWFREMLHRNGFVVINEDIGVNVRDPIVHFKRPAT